MEEFLKSHPALIVVNTLQRCNGVITRHRKTTVGEEQSILDLFIVCQQILPHIKHMQIDHKGEYWLTNFSAKKRTNKVTNSDHYPVILVQYMSCSATKPKRISQFNFKDPVGQMEFFEMTDKNHTLSAPLSAPQATHLKNKLQFLTKEVIIYFIRIFQRFVRRSGNSKKMMLVS